MVRRNLIITLVVIALTGSNFSARAQTTTIWLVRHAEKLTVTPANRNPGLTGTGAERALQLARVLQQQHIGAIYSTGYKRTLATVAPLAALLKLSPVIYDANDLAGAATKVLTENRGKTILVAGHSNTLLPFIKALNASTPFDELQDDDYDMLFKIVVSTDGTAQLHISHYGALHHVTAIPVAFAQPVNK